MAGFVYLLRHTGLFWWTNFPFFSMIPALLLRLRSSALYLLLMVLLFAGSARSLLIALPIMQRADTAERQLEPFDREAYADVATNTSGREELLAKIAATHHHYDELRLAAHRALLPTMGFWALLMLGLMVYERSESQKTFTVVTFFTATVMYFGLLSAIHWHTLRRLGAEGMHLVTDVFTAPQHHSSQLLLLALLAGAALCYDLLRPRKAPAGEPS